MKLNDEQRTAVEYKGNKKNILVKAGAGCGKTRTIIGRAKHLINSGTNSSRILMITFTNQAVNEMKSHLTDSEGLIQVGTFHSFCYKAIRSDTTGFGLTALDVIDSDDQKALMKFINKIYLNKNKGLNVELPKPKDLIKYYSYSKNTCQEPEEYLAKKTELKESCIQRCCEMFSLYQKEKTLQKKLDFDDLLNVFVTTLKNNPKIRSKITGFYDEVLVDELQDTNPLQFEILKYFAEDNVRLFCVGDPAQSIYKFRGAEFQNINTFQETFNDSEIITLSKNYRSSQEILDLSNWLLGKSKLNYDTKLKAARGKSNILPSVSLFDNMQDEARWIAETIHKKNKAGKQFKDIMVLIRSAIDAKDIESEFIQKNIPYKFVKGTSLLKSKHVQDILSLLKIINNRFDYIAWRRFIKLWPMLGEKKADKIINMLKKNPIEDEAKILSDALGESHNAVLAYKLTKEKDNPKECVSKAIELLMPVLYKAKNDIRADKFNSLISIAKKYTSLGEFINDFALEPKTETENTGKNDCVLLTTVHSAKGMEAPICFVANAKQGAYPHKLSCGDIDLEEEERRILYVALTRAKNELFITRSLHYGQVNQTVGENDFLANIPDNLVTRNNHSVFTKHLLNNDIKSREAILDDFFGK